MYARGYFVTGTDTGCGKTEVSLALMHKLQSHDQVVLGMKPVASGASLTADGLRNDDALRLQAQGSVNLAYDKVNPYAFAPPVAPHLAAAQAGIEIKIDMIREQYARLSQRADKLVVEGVGGWRVPLGAEQDMAQLAVRLGLPVILVVGLKLGCLNHALLSAESISASGASLIAWVANAVDPEMALLEENVVALESRLDCPCLGVVPWLDNIKTSRVAESLRLPEEI